MNLSGHEIHDSVPFLRQDQIEEFRARGVLRLREFLSSEICTRLVNDFWQIASGYGIVRGDVTTWTIAGDPSLKMRPFKAALKRIRLKDLYTESLRRVASLLLGIDDYVEHSPQLLITFPYLPSQHSDKTWETPRSVWHTDCPRLPNIETPGVVVLNYLADVEPEGGGTVIVAGSHRLSSVVRELVSSRQLKKKLNRFEFFKRLFSKGPDRSPDLRGVKAIVDDVEVEVVELDGRSGDVVFLDGRVLHSIAENIGTSPRLMVKTFFASPALYEGYAIEQKTATSKRRT